MKDIKLSVVLAVFNEEKNLARCLESVKSLADEIVIVDGQSTDQTPAIAGKFKARVISTPNLPNFHVMKNMAIDAAKGDWILQLDADEPVTPELATEIQKVISSPDALDGYWVPRKNYFLGRFLTKGGQYPDYTLRLYRRGKGRLPAQSVHEQATVDGQVGFLTHDLLHYGTPDFENYLLRFNRYTSLTATQMAADGVPLNTFSFLKYLLVKPISIFFSIYFRHLGLVDGFPGFVFALYSGLHYPVAYIKHWQKTKHPA